MADIDKERIAWYEQSLAIRSKNAKLITDENFSIPKPYIFKLTSYMDIEALSSLLSPQEQELLSNGKIDVVDCYLFNHRYADGSFFKMRLKFNPADLEYGEINLGAHFIAPWQEVIHSGSVKESTYVKIYGYREGGKVVFVFSRPDLGNIHDPVMVRGHRDGFVRSVFVLSRSESDNNPEVVRLPM